MILWWKWSLVGVEGDLCEGFGLCGTQEAFGQARFPPNPLKKWFYRDFAQSRGLVGAPWPSMVPAYCPFVGQWPILYNSRSTRLGGPASQPLDFSKAGTEIKGLRQPQAAKIPINYEADVYAPEYR